MNSFWIDIFQFFHHLNRLTLIFSGNICFVESFIEKQNCSTSVQTTFTQQELPLWNHLSLNWSPFLLSPCLHRFLMQHGMSISLKTTASSLLLPAPSLLTATFASPHKWSAPTNQTPTASSMSRTLPMGWQGCQSRPSHGQMDQCQGWNSWATHAQQALQSILRRRVQHH